MGVKGKYLKIFRASLLGTGLVMAGGISFFSTDWMASKFIERYQPELEKELSKKLGHPLLIGQYKGLKSWGVSFGSTKLLSGYKDQSTGEASNLSVQFAPVLTIFNRRPTLIFTIDEAIFNLKRNESGSYWTFGSSESNRPTNVELIFRLNEPATIFIEPANLLVKATAKLNLNLAESRAKGRLGFNVPKHGSFSLTGVGNWNKLNFQAKANLSRFNLKPLESFLPSRYKLKTRGIANGALQLGIKEGQFNCQGRVIVTALNVREGSFKDSLASDKIGLNCDNDYLELPLARLKYGSWQGTLQGNIPLQDSSNLNLAMSASAGLVESDSNILNLDAVLPFWIDKQKLVTGPLSANYEIDSYSLSSLSSIINTSLAGNLSANGSLYGPLSSLTTDFSFSLDNPQFTRVRLQERWRGKFSGAIGGGGELEMQSIGAALPSNVSAKFNNKWRLEDLLAKRLGGQISLRRGSNRYKWTAENFRLDRIELATPPEQSFKRIFGQLSGKGEFDFNPLFIDGRLSLGYPRVIGIKLKEVQVEGSYFDKNYSIDGELFPLDKGKILINAEGRINGSLKTKAELRKVSPSWLITSALQLPKVNTEISLPRGRAQDLGRFVIEARDGSLDNQIRQWVRSVIAVSQEQNRKRKKEIIDPSLVKGYVDAVIEIQGEDLSRLNMNLKASGKLWKKNQTESDILQIKPFSATIKGPLWFGNGDFSVVNIPLSLLSLFIPSPSGLTGMFGFTGKYRLGKGRPEVTADLIFNQVGLGSKSIILKRGKISFSESILKLDLALQNSSSSEPITLVGQIPLSPSLPLDLRVESHGDGISFLDEFFEDRLIWEKGSADLRLLITGTIENPYANGYLVVRNGELIVNERLIQEINGTMVFDFNRVEIQELTARIGDNGTINGNGDIALFRADKVEKKPLSINVNNVRFRSSFSDVELSSDLKLVGSLVKPVIGGNVIVSKGSISTQRKSTTNQPQSSNQTILNSYEGSRVNSLPEQKWNWQDPLVLFIRDENAPASKLINSTIPNGFSNISFDNLRLNLGPRLRIASPPVTSFEVDGFLLLNGPFNQTLNASGLVRLLNGRVNLFTTTFILDRREPNVAIFVPSMGLIPYVDVKLTTRVPDTVRDPNQLTSSSDFMTNGSGAFGIGGSRFVKVEVMATGPADRLKDNYQLRSTPPIPENELLGLIGGNSLANLFEGRDSTVFADVLSRSLVTPVLGNISGALSERLQITLYPAYVNSATSDKETVDTPSTSNTEESNDGLSPEQAWVTEVGIDLTDRITFSVQATPNREDIPPQGNLTFQLNQNFGLLGSFDQNGNWQSQLEIFIRY